MRKKGVSIAAAAGLVLAGVALGGAWRLGVVETAHAQAGSNNWDYRWTGNFRVSYFHSTEQMETDETVWENVKTIGINENWLMVEQPAQGSHPKRVHLVARDNLRNLSFSDM